MIAIVVGYKEFTTLFTASGVNGGIFDKQRPNAGLARTVHHLPLGIYLAESEQQAQDHKKPVHI
ncbi:MAG: hypothetical protein PHP04_11360 [Bacteroidales bacterium]|nr:hypothetical protein [Bacteroidales bacterium]HNW72491.1 hypothetical protein [Bacteroidales bacterium]HPS51565.1 hypothetical protein [Bacteroidales bacterium]